MPHPSLSKPADQLLPAQVGSKNAAFYLGQSVKMTTKTQDARFVHQLCLAASELEARYKSGEVHILCKVFLTARGRGPVLEPSVSAALHH